MPKPGSKYTINGTRGADALDGSIYSDALQSGGLIINGLGGNDTVKGGFGRDVLNGGDGDDRVYGALDDLVGVGDGKVVWDGGRGNDTLDLTAIVSDPGKGVWVALDYGPQSASSLETNIEKSNDYSLNWFVTWEANYQSNFNGFENVVAGSGDDVITFFGNSGNNTAYAGAGNDWIDTGQGNDTIFGEAGDDIITGGWGNDTASGGAGNDIFAFTGRLSGQYTYDVITDFSTANDQIWLYPGWSLAWDASSQTALHGYLSDQGTVFGEITISNLTYGSSGSVRVYNVDLNTGQPQSAGGLTSVDFFPA